MKSLREMVTDKVMNSVINITLLSVSEESEGQRKS